MMRSSRDFGGTKHFKYRGNVSHKTSALGCAGSGSINFKVLVIRILAGAIEPLR
jgi:hypothetical protein